MTFTSLTFLLFFPLAFGLYWLRRDRVWQNSVIVLASYFFYGWWDWRFCLLMLFSSLVDYFLGQAVWAAEKQSTRRVYLWMSIVCNLGLLSFFKYFNFFSESLVQALGSVGWQVHPIVADILLPVGISFYTFQTLSYTIDIYRGNLAPSKSLVDYLAFVSFFPQLVAGPIERATNLIPQFSQARVFSHDEAVSGCRYILWGFAKKLVIADRLAAFVDLTYSDPQTATGVALIFATVFFAFQIYCDFSAYSDIAIGTAKLFRIDLMRNFDYPYFSQSVTEFWRRWHISLSTWFRDYVFIPLGGSRGSTWRTQLNLLITFILSGLWHGAAWRFILWGAINGAALIGEKMFRTRQSVCSTPGGESNWPAVTVLLRMTYTFTVICIGWVFFRADSMSDAFLILQKMLFAPVHEWVPDSIAAVFDTPQVKTNLWLLCGFVAIEWVQRRNPHPLVLVRFPVAVRWTAYSLLIWGTLNFMLTGKLNPFIYFTF